MPNESANIKERNSINTKEPDKFNVIFHNDDFTPMDFVTFVLKRFFFKDDLEAERLMLKVHLEGKAVVGSYAYDIAVSKTTAVTELALQNGFPLRITVSMA